MSGTPAWLRALWPFGRSRPGPEQSNPDRPGPEKGDSDVSAPPPEVVTDGTAGGASAGQPPPREISERDRAAFPDEFARLRHSGPKPPSYSQEPSAAPDAARDTEAAVIPDTAAHGFAVANLVVRGASVAGDLHRLDGDPRQDAFAVAAVGPPERGLVIAVVADGVGSQPRSHLGANTAAKATVAALTARAGQVEAALRGGLRDRLYFELVHVVDEIAAAVTAEAARLSRPPRELATTLRAVVVPTDPDVRARLAASVGDGATVRLSGAEWTPVRPAADGAEAGVHDTATAVLPLQPEALAVDIWTAAPGETTVVCTDGLSEPLRDKEFAGLLAEDWNQDEVPGMMRFLWEAQSRMRTYDDDRTVICIWERSTMSPAV